MAEKYVVTLSDEERNHLTDITTKGKAGARKINRAHILRLADSGKTDTEIGSLLQTPVSTVHRTRQRCVEEGFLAALSEKPRPGRPRCLDGKQEAFLIALACTNAPDGRKRWTVRLLGDHLVELKVCDAISRETVRRTLKKTKRSRGSRNSGVFLG